MIEITAPQWIGMLIGFGIGAAAELWGIANPESIIRLARWKDRLFIACVSVGGSVAVPVLFGLYALGIQMHFGLKDFYPWGLLLGGILFGTGMAISGYFPGSEWMALGEGRRDALYAVPAGLMGAFAWTMLSSTGLGQWLVQTHNLGQILVTGKTIAESNPNMLFLLAIVFTFPLLTVAWFIPRYQASKHVCLRAQLRGRAGHDEDSPVLHAIREDNVAYLLEGSIARKGSKAEKFVRALASEPNSYSPVLVIVAVTVALVVVLGLVLHQIFGESTTYSWLVSFFTPSVPYSQTVQRTIGWEPFSDLGTYLGAFFSAVVISKRYTAFRKIIPPSWRNRFGDSQIKRAFGVTIGSFLVLFGARMAGGCASGHILSGIFQMAASGIFFGLVVITSTVIAARLIYGNVPETVSTRPITPGPASAGAPSGPHGLEFKYFGITNKYVARLIVVGIILTVAVGATATNGDTGYSVNVPAWMASLLIPLFMALFVAAYFGDQPAYGD
jgi:uncharacterized protein